MIQAITGAVVWKRHPGGLPHHSMPIINRFILDFAPDVYGASHSAVYVFIALIYVKLPAAPTNPLLGIRI
jgi:hypothetical protein